MNWRRLIYSIIVPGIVSFIFALVISVGMVTNMSVFLYAICMTAAAILSSTGHGKNGDAPSTLFMGILVGVTTYLLITVLGDLGGKFSWIFVLKTVGFVAAIAATIYFAKSIMENKPQNGNQN